jgi:hypothetical protein
MKLPKISPETIVIGIAASAAIYIVSRLSGNQTLMNAVDAVQNAGTNLGALFTSDAQKQADINTARGLDPVSGLLTPTFAKQIDDAGGMAAYIAAHGGSTKGVPGPVTSQYRFWL